MHGPYSSRSSVDSLNKAPGDKERKECAQAYVDSIFTDFNQEFQFKPEINQVSANRSNRQPGAMSAQREAELEKLSSDYVSGLLLDIEKAPL